MWSEKSNKVIEHCDFYVSLSATVDYTNTISYTVEDYLSREPSEKVEDTMARKQNDDLLIEDELAAAFLNDDDLDTPTSDNNGAAVVSNDEPVEDDFPGQLAVDVYETEERLIVKARTAGVNKDELDVSISDGILTISGTLSSGDDVDAINWHIQECYWGEFSRTLALPVAVKEDEVEALKSLNEKENPKNV